MGFIRVSVRVFAPTPRGESLEVEALVDTGAIYSVFPRPLLESLGVEVDGSRVFRAIQGQRFERDIGAVRIEVQGYRALVPVPVIFGEQGDGIVLGVTALETLGLKVDPVRGELRPTEFLLL